MVDGQSEPLYTHFGENKHDSKLVQTHPGGALRQVYDLTSSGGFKFTWLHGSPHGVLEDISTSSLAEHWDVTKTGSTLTIHAFTYARKRSSNTDYGTLQYASSDESTGHPDGTVTTTSMTQWSGSPPETNPPTTVQYITGLAAHKDDFVNPLIQFQYPTGFVEALLTEIANAAALVSSVYSTLAELPPVQAALSNTFYDEALGIGFSLAAMPVNYAIDTYNNLRNSGYNALEAGMVTAFDMLGHVVGSDNLANLIEGRNAAGAKLSGFQLSIDAGLLGIKVFTAGISGAAVVHAGRVALVARMAAGAHSAPAGLTVLGKFPYYLELGEELGANVLNTRAWNALSPAERLYVNRAFLEAALARGDQIVLASNAARATGYFEWEINFLISRGARLSPDGWRIVLPLLP